MITFEDIDLPLCPNGQFLYNQPYIAAYWVQADLSVSGNVYYRQEIVISDNEGAYVDIVEEINRGQEHYVTSDWEITTSDVTSVIYITWEEMKPPYSIFVNVSENMLRLISTSRIRPDWNKIRHSIG